MAKLSDGFEKPNRPYFGLHYNPERYSSKFDRLASDNGEIYESLTLLLKVSRSMAKKLFYLRLYDATPYRLASAIIGEDKKDGYCVRPFPSNPTPYEEALNVLGERITEIIDDHIIHAYKISRPALNAIDNDE